MGLSIGILLAAPISLALLIFYIVSLVKAVSRKSTVLIISTVVSGVLTLLIVSGTLYVLYVAVTMRDLDKEILEMKPNHPSRQDGPSISKPEQQVTEGVPQ